MFNDKDRFIQNNSVVITELDKFVYDNFKNDVKLYYSFRVNDYNNVVLHGNVDSELSLFNRLVNCINNCDDVVEYKFNRKYKNNELYFNTSDLQFDNGYYRYSDRYSEYIIVRTNVGIVRIEFVKMDTKSKKYAKPFFVKFKDICKDFGIDLDDYLISESERDSVIKELKNRNNYDLSIRVRLTPYVNEYEVLGKTFENVHHLDLNSSYMSGLVYYHPEFKNVIEYLYSNKKNAENEEDKQYWKDMLTLVYGYMYSTKKGNLVNGRLAHLSRDMIKYNDMMLDTICYNMIETGRLPILFNTDGIWYQGDIYHDEYEGTELGQWKTDHKNCTWRCRSSGCYEYVEDGVYHGQCRRISPDKFVEWGDIFREDKTTDYLYSLNKDGTITRYEVNFANFNLENGLLLEYKSLTDGINRK